MCMDGMRRACVRVEIQILSRRCFALGSGTARLEYLWIDVTECSGRKLFPLPHHFHSDFEDIEGSALPGF